MKTKRQVREPNTIEIDKIIIITLEVFWQGPWLRKRAIKKYSSVGQAGKGGKKFPSPLQ